MTEFADRLDHFDASGIRKVFDLAASLKNPINLSIGQPDFDVPTVARKAAADAIATGRNGYSPTQGIAPLRERLTSDLVEPLGQPDRELFVCSGTSGGLVLSMLAFINPGDEVIYGDPYFVMYPPLLAMCGGVGVPIDTAPTFQLDPSAVEAAITPRTKMILVNSPANPTGVIADEASIKAIADIARRHNLILVSDEIYSRFVFDSPAASPVSHYDKTIVIDGFSKSYAMTGWRIGYVHAPAKYVSAMLKLQQYTYICSPQPLQWAAVEAMNVDLSDHIAEYARRRDYVYDELAKHYEVTKPGGAFYIFPRVPSKYDGGEAFVRKAIENELLIIPGNIFSQHDTHFRLSFAADQSTLQRGLDVLKRLA